MTTIGIGTQTPEQALATLSDMTKTLVPIQPEEHLARIATAQAYMLANNIDAIYLNAGTNQTSVLLLQILGSLYLGFGMLNWMTKNNLIGGIYSRPLVIGNLAHFLVSSFALIKIVGKYSESEFPIILTITIIYAVFTLCFGYVFMKNPNKVVGTN